MVPDTFKADYFQYTGESWTPRKGIPLLIRNRTFRFLYVGRKSIDQKGLGKFISRLILHVHKNKYGLEFGPFSQYGKALALCHPFNITLNNDVVLGENVTLFKGVTLGEIISGTRRGVPTVGNRVVICANATVCGGIRVGNDVLIAAGAFVDFNVPDNSVVVGNPGVIHHKENPAADYLIPNRVYFRQRLAEKNAGHSQL